MTGDSISPSRVEERAVSRGGEELVCGAREKIGVIVVDNFPALGKLASLRFIEWIQRNPEGVISLPTGRSPEFFIKWVSRYLSMWKDPGIQKDLEENGVDSAMVPSTRGLRFVQMDEFYPIDPSHQNSFYFYVNKYYIAALRLDPKRCLLIDCAGISLPDGKSMEEVWPGSAVDVSLRFRHPRSALEEIQKRALERVDRWCSDYEDCIRGMGGIGFFLGGIGPDGHIAFNMRGSDHHSVTRLSPTNYETQAAASIDLGGIEVVRERAVITIGLSTITCNPSCVAIILAAGEARASVVRDAVEGEADISRPATALRSLREARFYLTRGAARLLEERRYRALTRAATLPREEIERIVVDAADRLYTAVRNLSEPDFRGDRFGALVLEKTGRVAEEIVREVDRSLKEKIEAGSTARSSTAFLHTAPHHDDIILGYLPYAVRNIRDASNTHVFAYMTSGFTAVTNGYALSMLERLRGFLREKAFVRLLSEDYFSPANVNGRRRDVWQYLDGVAENNQGLKHEGEARRLLRNLIEIFEEEDIGNLRNRIDELINYFKTQYPGKKDLPYIQKLKGMIREWESDCKWGYLGFDSGSVHHLRLGFYQGELFTEEPLVERDVAPVLELLRRVRPDVVTVALDPEGSGPDTHYKVLQAVAESLRLFEKESEGRDIAVLGYRNVWHRFHPGEANVYVPVSLNMFAVLQNAFVNAFGSQRGASFPSHELDGTFAELAQRIQVEQYRLLKTCLGREFFHEHPSPLIRATRGFVFLKLMSCAEFFSHARELKKSAEAV